MKHPGFTGNVTAWDPGRTTGFAIFSGQGERKEFGQLTMEEVDQFIDEYAEPVSVVVVEDFINFKKRVSKMAGSRNDASQVIGMLRVFARKKGAKFLLQPAGRKDEGAKLTQIFEPSDHSQSHWVSAYNHGFWFLHNLGLVRSKLEVERLG